MKLVLNPSSATISPASDIFVVNDVLGTDSGITGLVNLMEDHGLHFYNLMAKDDVVLIKVSWQWDQRGRTNSDLLKGLIQKIIDHPDGFTGEIVVADNGQGKKVGTVRVSGPTPITDLNNAEDHSLSIQDVVNSFSSYKVSTSYWDNMRQQPVDEYTTGNMADGYVVSQTFNPRTGIQVSYPKFRTSHGTYISFKYGIWNGYYDSAKLKVINIATLKTHMTHGTTTSVKHYMGVVSEKIYGQQGLTESHDTIAVGGMGTMMAETRFPTLNIIDAIYVNANPLLGPETAYSGYSSATQVNVVMASRDPVALDYWAMRHVLMQAAQLKNPNADLRSIDPDYPGPVGQYQVEAPGVWLNRSKDEIILGGFQATSNEAQMNVYVAPEEPPPPPKYHVLTVDSNLQGISFNLRKVVA